MKKRTWLISALMYTAVLAVCIGVLYLMNRVMDPGGEQAVQSIPAAESTAGEAGEKETKPQIPETEEAETEEGQEEKEEVLEREDGYHGWKQELPGIWLPGEEPYEPPEVILATDLHYQSSGAHDDGEAYRRFVEQGDGKVAAYLPQLLEAFLDQVIKQQPSALILSGDISMDGERINHEELFDRLKRVEEAGIPVLVIPGNHDINNPNASVYFGDAREGTPGVNGQEFYEIYREYGYDEALSRDSASLSYVYELDEKNWLLMLDSCQYEPQNRVEGRLKPETLQWMDGQLALAKEQGKFVLPVAHHNLLEQSRMYTTQCAMENNQEVIQLLEQYELPLYFSGHLHVQRMRKHKNEPGVPEDAYGIQEIIMDALSIPPCQYGVLSWKEDGSLAYETKSVDVSSWARTTGSSDENLLDFEKWSYEYIQKLISDQIQGVVKNLGEDVEQSMAAVYAAVYIDYYAGRKIDAQGVRTSLGYRWWQRNMPDSYLMRELEAMIRDSDRDNNYFLLPERSGWGGAEASP